MDQEFVEKKSIGKIIGIISAIILTLGLIFLLFYYLFFLNVTPDNYLKEVANKTSNYITDTLNIFSNIKTNHELKTTKNIGNLKFNSEGSETEFLNDYNFDYNLITSYQDDETRLDLTLKEKDNDFLKSIFYLNKDSLYLKSDLYDKVIRLVKLNNNIYNSKDLLKETYTVNDIKVITEKYMKYYFEAFQEIEMKKENISFTELKYVYNLTDKNIKKVDAKFKELCSNDNKLKNIEIPNLSLTKTKLEVTMNRFTKEINEILITKDNKETDIIKVDDNKYEINKEDKIIIAKDKITFEDYDKETLSSTLELSKTKEEIRVKVTNKDINMELSLKKINDSNLRIYLSLSNNLEVKTIIDLDMDIKFNDNNTNSKILGTIKSGTNKFEIEVNNTSSYIEEKIENIDIDDAINIDDLKEEDTNKIIENLLKILLESNLGNLLENNSNV